MKIFEHFLCLLVSVICLLLSEADIPVELYILITIPYFWYIVKSVKQVPNGQLLPPFLLSLSTFVTIIIGVLPIKYNWFPLIYYVYGAFANATLCKCVAISMVGLSSLWLSFLLLYKKKMLLIGDVKSVRRPFLNTQSFSYCSALLLMLFYFVLSGNFGYFSKDSSLDNITNKLYTLILFIPTAYFLYDNNSGKNKRKYLLVFIILSVLGAISGSKSFILLPFVILVIVEYIKTGKWTNKYMKYLPTILLISFIIIIPIRYVISEKQGSLSREQSIDLVSEVAASSDNTVLGMVTSDFFMRINYVPVLASAVDYKGSVPSSITNLWEYTFMSPIYAIVPRSIFPSKPENDFTKWYAYNVCHSTEENNMSATYQGILYMNGGILSVIFGFLLVGVLFYAISKFWLNANYIYIYISQIMTFIILPAEPWVLFTSIIQNFILFYIFHLLITNKHRV